MKFKNKKTGEIVEWDCIKINSALVSAQTRKRLYWTNIPNVTQPEDKRIILKDIIEKGDSFEVSEKRKKIIEKNLGDRINDETEIIGSSQKNAYVGKDKSSSLTSAMGEGGGHVPMLKIDPSKPNQINPDKSAKSSSENEKGTQPHMQDRVFHEDGKSHALTASFASRTKVGKFEEDQELRPATIVGRRLNERGVRDDYNKDVPITQCLQVKHNSDKSGTLTTVEKDNVLSENKPGRYPNAYEDKKLSWRKLTPLECERLQTVPDGYTLVLDENGKQLVSNSQRYKMLGNGWTVDVIMHIFKNLKQDYK